MEEVSVVAEVTAQKIQEEPKGLSVDGFSRGREATPARSGRSDYRERYGLAVQSQRSWRSLRPEVAAPSDKLRRKQAKKEILRRALTPPVKRPTLRWLDFRPTPSRLRNMSTA